MQPRDGEMGRPIQPHARYRAIWERARVRLHREAVVPQNDGVIQPELGKPAPSIIEGRPCTIMPESTCLETVCVVDGTGRIVREAKVASEPEALITWFASLATPLERVSLEAGPLSQWLYAGLREAGVAVELLETRHVRDAFKAMSVKTDRNDAPAIAPDAARLVPAGALQVDRGAGGSCRLTARKLLQKPA